MKNKQNLTAADIRGHRLLILRRILAYSVLGLTCLIALFPFAMLLINTTKDSGSLTSSFSIFPGTSFLDNFEKIMIDTNTPLFQSMMNSFIVATLSSVLSVYFSTLTAYGLFAYTFRLRKAAFIFIMIILMVPTQVSALGFVEMVKGWGLGGTWVPLIFPTIASPAVFFFIKEYMESSLPVEIVEAGRIDGGAEFYIFNRVVLPILKPAMSVQLIFQFVASWNNYFLPQLLIDTNSENATLPLVIAGLNAEANRNFDLGKIYMVLAIAIIPIIIVYLFLSKHIIRGVALGSVKG